MLFNTLVPEFLDAINSIESALWWPLPSHPAPVEELMNVPAVLNQRIVITQYKLTSNMEFNVTFLAGAIVWSYGLHREPVLYDNVYIVITPKCTDTPISVIYTELAYSIQIGYNHSRHQPATLFNKRAYVQKSFPVWIVL